ncbi:MAG: hypothetical protein HXY26_07690 [Hydrogenophilaceae bacterium]|nr:hypothetical protein [Hydrogenophilaceae bacterium]
MSETIPASLEGSQRQGSCSLGNLRISWQAWRSTPAGWQAECLLQLGNSMSQIVLNEDNPSQSFQLSGDGETAWGSLDLTPAANGDTLLGITYQTSGLAEQIATLHIWNVCRTCDHVPPMYGNAFLGNGGWLKVGWTITGSEDTCQKVLLNVETADGIKLGRDTLTPQQPEWYQVIQQGYGYAELLLAERFHVDGRIMLEATLRHTQSPTQQVTLAVLPGGSPVPEPEPDDKPGDTLVLGPPRNFASFTYPRALQPPSAGQQGRRFFSLSNTGAFQTQLASLKAKPDRAGMVALAQGFKNDPAQFVDQIASLQGAMGRLQGPAVQAFLSLHPETLAELNAALEALLGEPVASFLQDPNYEGQWHRLQDSVIAIVVLGSRIGRHEADLIRALMVCHVATWLNALIPIPQGNPSPQPTPTPEPMAEPTPTPIPLPIPLSTPAHMREVLQANSLLPDNILPLPQAPATSTVSPLGYADIKIIRQRLKRYRLGELAHVENVMRGETKEETQQHSRQIESQQNDTQLSHDSDQRKLDYDGRSHQSEATASSPINDLKREFDSLKKLYDSDGLSVTVSGGWTDTLDGPTTLDDQATLYARNLLDRASSRVARRVSKLRQQRTLEEFSELHRRRFQNEAGTGHLIGLYRWVDEIHVAHLEQVGSRLILECNLSNPAANFLQRSNALHGINLSVPVPPWVAADGIGAVNSANDITRANYLSLAGRYGADVRPPPPQQRIVNANLGTDPPHPIAMLPVPDGYLAASANIAYAWATPPSPAGQGNTPPPTFDVLVGDAAQKIDPGSDPNPGTKTLAAVQATDGALPVSIVAAGLAYAVNVSLVCQCPDDSPLFRQWQIDTYAEIVAAYRLRKEETNRIMGLLAEEFARPGSEGRRETEREELRHGAIQALIAPCLALDTGVTPPPLTPEQVEFELIPFFRQAVEWAETSFSYFGRYSAGSTTDWLNMVQTVGQDDGFHEFLQAGSAKLLLPVGPAYVLPMLFYLASGGYFWFGEPGICPVFEHDLWLANELKSLARRPPEPIPFKTWEIEVATSLLMLQQDGTLPNLIPGQSDDDTEAGRHVF